MRINYVPVALVFIFYILAIWVPTEKHGGSQLLVIGRYACYAGAAGLIAFLGLRNWSRQLGSLRALMLLGVLCLFWGASSIWSQSPIESTVKSALLLVTFFAAASIACASDVQRKYGAIVGALSCFVLASFLVCIFIPTIGLESSYQHAGKWKGLAAQKNPFGLISATTFILLMAPRNLLPGPLQPVFARLAMLSVTATCLWMSGSRSAIVDVAAAIAGIAFILMSNRARILAVTLGCGCVAIALVWAAFELRITDGQVDVLGMLIDTNNRTTIWSFAFEEWKGREALGVGYGAFWSDDTVNRFETLNGWALPNFHNGYISLLIESGIVGAALFLLFSVALWLKVVRSAKNIKDWGLYPLVGIFSMFFVHNLYENNLTRSTDFFMLTFFVSVGFIDYINSNRASLHKLS